MFRHHHHAETDYRRAKTPIGQFLNKRDSNQVKKPQTAVHKLATQNAILQIENRGFMAALSNEKKKRKRGKTVIAEIRAEGQSNS